MRSGLSILLALLAGPATLRGQAEKRREGEQAAEPPPPRRPKSAQLHQEADDRKSAA